MPEPKSIYLSEELLEWVRDTAEMNKRTFAGQIRHLVEQARDAELNADALSKKSQ